MKKTMEWRKNTPLSEIYQGGLQMALVGPTQEDGSYKQATTFVTCKDFFQDALQAHHLQQPREIWRFKYDPAKDPALSTDLTRVAIGNNLDKDFASKIEGVVDFINQFEKRIHLKKTVATECNQPPEKWAKHGGVYLFEGSSRWMIAPPMMSLYCLLLRCGFLHKKGNDFDETCDGIINGKIALLSDKAKQHSGCNDDTYLSGGQVGIKAIVKHGYAKLFYKDPKKNYPEKIPVSTMHDRCGIVGYSSKAVKDLMPYWFKQLEPKVKKKKVAADKK